MKTKNVIKKLYKAIIEDNKERVAKLYRKVTKKSLKHKKTHVVK
jgi:hypothetical protein